VNLGPCEVEDTGPAWDNRRSGGPSPTMTARADRLTKRAKTAGSPSSLRSSYPASSARVFVDALERLNYSVESLLGDAGIRRADLDDPDARIPCADWGAMFRQALALRPMKKRRYTAGDRSRRSALPRWMARRRRR
jgi:hypothetical protein